MSDWTKATGAPAPATSTATASTAGVLRPDEFARHAQLRRFAAGREVERWVENHWALRWELPAGRSFASQVLPHPTASLTVETGTHPRPEVPCGETVLITGLVTRRFDVDVRGSGAVVGVRFRPGGLAALTGRSAAEWTNAVVAARDVLPPELGEALADPDLVTDPDAWAAVAERGLLDLAADPDLRYDDVLAIVRGMLDDHALVTVAEVGDRFGMSPRTLQRLFTHYVGIGPKWVLARYRMHDIVTEIDAGYDGTFTELAHRYGWYDQAHFTRDFTALVGVTPGAYRDEGRGSKR